MTLEQVESPSEMHARAAASRAAGQSIAFVPTMGALHEAHLALVVEARKRADIVVVSVFVNPKQFDQEGDLKAYPRTLQRDRELCEGAGVDLLFVPNAEEMYPPGFETRVVPGDLGRRWEGEHRPGHFEGMLTVVAKLLLITQPTWAIFGEKDFQQLALVRRMVADLSIPTDIVPMPVFRELDGLALSSRNRRLDEDARVRATCLFRALEAAQSLASDGERRAEVIERAAREILDETAGFAAEYAAVVDPATLEPIDAINRAARFIIAGQLGDVRLIDNGPLFLGRA
jgi:pantoate--beta-alanine ligase